MMSETIDKARDDRLLAELDEDAARLLYPERFTRPAAVTISFPPLAGEVAELAAPLLESASRVEDGTDPTRPGDPARTGATYTLDEVEALHGLFALLESSIDPEEIEIRIDDRRLPFVRELWLPLLWSLRS